MPEPQWTIKATLDWSQDYLASKGCENPLLSAQWLLSAATGLSKLELYTNFDKPLSVEERAVMREGLKRRAQGEPLQYIVGKAPFRFMELRTSPGVLIPRPETEMLVQLVLDACRERGHVEIADIGTGSGCIALALATELSDAHVYATDVSAEALKLASENVFKMQCVEKITLCEGSLGSALPAEAWGNLDVVVSNPPYVPTAVCNTLPTEVAFEPRLALDGGEDGLDVYRPLALWAYSALKPHGIFACELHETTLDEAADFARECGFDARVVHDLTQRPRFVFAEKRG